MANVMKYAQLKDENGQVLQIIPIGVDSSHVDVGDKTLDQVLSEQADLTDLAYEFVQSEVYKSGDYVVYGDRLYRLTADHAANVTWDSTSKVQVKLADQVSNLIKVSPTQPGGSSNKLWIDSDDEENIEIPTMEEFEEVRDDVNSLQKIRIADTSILLSANWRQGGWGKIKNYNDSQPNEYVFRKSTEIVFDDPIELKILITGTDFEIIWAAFDKNETLLSGNSTWSSDSTLPVDGVKVLRISVKWADDVSGHRIPITSTIAFLNQIRVVSLKRPNTFSEVLDNVWHDNYYSEHMSWEQGTFSSIKNYDDPGPTSGYRRVRGEMIFDSPVNVSVIIKNPVYQFVYAAFNSNNDRIAYYGNYEHDNAVYIPSVKTLRLILRNRDDTSAANVNIYIDELPSVGIEINRVLPLCDIKLKVMTYNIGRYSYGVEPKYLSENYEEKLANYKRFFSEERCDLIGLQELNDYLDVATGTGTKSSDAEIFEYLYPYHVNNTGNVCLKSKREIIDGKTLTLSTGRKMAVGYIVVNGLPIYVCSVHLSPNASGESNRRIEAEEIVTLLSKHEYFICCGDYNALQTDLFNIFTDAGFKLSNGGYLPMEWTYSFNRSDFTSDTPSDGVRYFDNIITSSNIIIDYSERKNTYTRLSSDHIPFVAYLTIT